MSEDEGTNSTAHGVPSEGEPDDGETNDGASDGAATDEANAESASDTEDDVTADSNEDVQDVLDRVTEYDDELATRVNSIVDEATKLSATVDDQRAELSDLSERVEAQAETIGDLQDELDAREEALAERDEQLESYEEQIEDLQSRLKRKQADFQNYKKRAKKRQKQLKDRATEDLVERLVGVRDNLKRALSEESGDADSLRDGVEMTLREFDRILEDENVSEVDPEPGTEVDPQRHEVMMNVDSDQPEGTVADVYTPGYEMGEKVIQNAQVTVSNGELVANDSSDSDSPDGQSDGAAEQKTDDAETADERVETSE
ncbi:nucleotide exchange factor GrpE [Natrialbaceae archaeon A-arb3/5]